MAFMTTSAEPEPRVKNLYPRNQMHAKLKLARARIFKQPISRKRQFELESISVQQPHPKRNHLSGNINLIVQCNPSVRYIQIDKIACPRGIPARAAGEYLIERITFKRAARERADFRVARV